MTQTLLKTDGTVLEIGSITRVVGTVCSLQHGFPDSPSQVASDIVEIRFDMMPQDSPWLERSQSIQAMGVPVILTVRSQKEGGKWFGHDEDRLPMYNQALEKLAAVDVEFHSEIGQTISEKAKALGKVCILSFHDFDKTPPVDALRSIVARAQKLASILKISTMINASKDIKTLETLLRDSWDVPICVIGMGPLGTQTRVSFANLGSCLTYGYLAGEPTAPGQLSAAELVARLRSTSNLFDKDYSSRKGEPR